jgi:UrcA family protein
VTKTLASTIALALLGAASGAQAQTAEIRYADLDLSSPAGQAAFERRVEGAARRVCEVPAPIGSRAVYRIEEGRCKAEVRQQVAAALPK